MTAWRFLFISLILHSLFWLSLKWVADYEQTKNSGPIEVTIIDHHNQMRMAHSTSSHISLSKLKPHFWGEKDQNVLTQTKAKNLGFINDQNKIKKSQSHEKEKDGFKLAQLGKDLLDENASDTADYHDINEGLVTALNTERFVYYSFFQRVDQRISALWTSYLRDYQNRWTQKDVDLLAGKSWITIVEVLLDEDGNYVKAYIHRSSGVGPIDQAVTDSFMNAGSFPNPPSGMLEDGFIHLKYSFRFNVDTARNLARQ